MKETKKQKNKKENEMKKEQIIEELKKESIMTTNNNNKTMAKEEYGEEIRCENCDGDDVEVRVWVKANVFPVEIAYHDWEDGLIWCADCKDLHYQKEEDE